MASGVCISAARTDRRRARKRGTSQLPHQKSSSIPASALSKGGPELPGQVAAAMALNLVEFREQLGECRHAHDHNSTWPDEPAQVRQSGPIVINMFDHVESEDSVECRVRDGGRTEWDASDLPRSATDQGGQHVQRLRDTSRPLRPDIPRCSRASSVTPQPQPASRTRAGGLIAYLPRSPAPDAFGLPPRVRRSRPTIGEDGLGHEGVRLACDQVVIMDRPTKAQNDGRLCVAPPAAPNCERLGSWRFRSAMI